MSTYYIIHVQCFLDRHYIAMVDVIFSNFVHYSLLFHYFYEKYILKSPSPLLGLGGIGDCWLAIAMVFYTQIAGWQLPWFSTR